MLLDVEIIISMSIIPSAVTEWASPFDSAAQNGVSNQRTTTPALLACLDGPPKSLCYPALDPQSVNHLASTEACVHSSGQAEPSVISQLFFIQSNFNSPNSCTRHTQPPMSIYLGSITCPPPNERNRSRPRRRPWSEHEDITLFNLYYLNGPNWDLISTQLSSMNTARPRTALDVRRRYEHILRRSMLTTFLGSKENRPPSTAKKPLHLVGGGVMTIQLFVYHLSRCPTNLHTSLPWKQKPKPYSASTDPASKQRRMCSPTLVCNSRPALGIQPMSQRNANVVLPSDQLTPTIPSLLSQLSVRKSSPERLTISLPCPSELATRQLSSRPIVQTSNPTPSTSSQSLVTRPQFNLTSSLPPASTCSISQASQVSIAPDTISAHPGLPSLPNAVHRSIAGSGYTTDDNFLVQTPTKALSETDQMSFHLVSPPAVLRNLASGNNSARYVGLLHRGFNDSEKASGFHRSVCTRLFDSPTDPLKHELGPERVDHVVRPVAYRSVDPSILSAPTDFDCLEVLTAKATVWNRAFTPISSSACAPISAPKASFSVHPTGTLILPQESSCLRRNGDSPCSVEGPIQEPLSPLLPLKFHPRQQPQLSCRRVVQIGLEDDWRQIALGTSHTHLAVTQTALKFLDNESVPFTKHEDVSSPLTEPAQASASCSPIEQIPTSPIEPKTEGFNIRSPLSLH
ncbi:Myb-like DNA-binding domain protein [Opisthorchis viverrini]|uniref:Myb-like DNA-binding domain protein n=1 Tax=Opisthorchis viverrini TaxID=6198 RepID=A0A1S8XAQ2_OPIVI|nr:Myb-like DNA-binding domain protein [Opisthorchis viverrini]